MDCGDYPFCSIIYVAIFNQNLRNWFQFCDIKCLFNLLKSCVVVKCLHLFMSAPVSIVCSYLVSYNRSFESPTSRSICLFYMSLLTSVSTGSVGSRGEIFNLCSFQTWICAKSCNYTIILLLWLTDQWYYPGLLCSLKAVKTLRKFSASTILSFSKCLC